MIFFWSTFFIDDFGIFIDDFGKIINDFVYTGTKIIDDFDQIFLKKTKEKKNSQMIFFFIL